MAKYSRFDPRNKKANRHKRQSQYKEFYDVKLSKVNSEFGKRINNKVLADEDLG